MIPKLIHQTWCSPKYTRNDGTPASWRAMNPDWEYRLWTDPELDQFVADNYPEYIDLYRSYPHVVQQADLGRYLLLHKFGGVYADMDTDCLASFDPLCDETRIVFGEEPRAHWGHATIFGFDRFLFNGTMASPAGHPFWRHVAETALRGRHAAPKNVLVSTGPIMLSWAVQNWPNQDDFALNSCHIFSPNDKDGVPVADAVAGPLGDLRLSRHNWSGSWFSDFSESPWRRVKGALREAKSKLGRRVRPLGPEAIAKLDQPQLLAPPRPIDPENLPQIAIFTPVKDGAEFLEHHMALISALDWPKDRLRLVYCEGDSRDNSRAELQRLKTLVGDQFAGFEVVHHDVGLRLARKDRWRRKHQLRRRAAVASARNALVKQGLRDEDEWVLWLDVDVCAFPSDVLHQLLAAQEKIVTPDCVLDPGGRSFDLNAYLETSQPGKSAFFKHVHDGLYQPPDNIWQRLHMHDLRFAYKVPLTAVGGAMLLVHGSVHRAGLDFAERPYRFLIETEAFGRMANDAGLTPYGLPNLEVRHVKS